MKIESQHYEMIYLGKISLIKGLLSTPKDTTFYVLRSTSELKLDKPLIMTIDGEGVSIMQEEELDQYYGLQIEAFLDDAYAKVGFDRYEKINEELQLEDNE